jgi:hypothetical protein
MTDELEIMKTIVAFQFAQLAARRAVAIENNKLWLAEKAAEKKEKLEDAEGKAKEALALAKTKHAAVIKAKEAASKACAEAYFEWADAKEKTKESEAKTFELLNALAELNVKFPFKELQDGAISRIEIFRVLLGAAHD